MYCFFKSFNFFEVWIFLFLNLNKRNILFLSKPSLVLKLFRHVIKLFFGYRFNLFFQRDVKFFYCFILFGKWFNFLCKFRTINLFLIYFVVFFRNYDLFLSFEYLKLFPQFWMIFLNKLFFFKRNMIQAFPPFIHFLYFCSFQIRHFIFWVFFLSF